MERRSWIWGRKSSESSGGSISSHSERFSDDQAYSNQSCESPMAEAATEKTLLEKLSAALVNISVKEDMVKQHSKLAEEAVEGWEKAENEVLALRQQLDVVMLSNSTLEDRVSQLDGALKECLTQLRQTREESIEMVEKENMALKLELASMAEELELRFIERELSNQAAEQASKLHLESVQKAAKFEAECRRLNSALEKALLAANNDDRSVTDSQRDHVFAPSMDINLMDDFIEMERLVALPEGDLVQKNVCSEVEERLKKLEEERLGLENELRTSRNEMKEAVSKLAKMETLLTAANEAREMTMKQVVEVQSQLDEVESRCKALETEVKMERVFSGKMEAKCRYLESEISRLQHDNQYPKAELRVKQDLELALAGSKFADCQKTIASLSQQLKSLAILEDLLIDTNDFKM